MTETETVLLHLLFLRKTTQVKPRLQKEMYDMETFCNRTSVAMDTVGMRSFHDMLETDRGEEQEPAANYGQRVRLRRFNIYVCVF